MNVKQEINPKAFIFTLPYFFFIAALSEASEKLTLRLLYKSHSGAKSRQTEHSFLKRSDVTDITFQHTYGLFLMIKLILQNLKVYYSK